MVNAVLVTEGVPLVALSCLEPTRLMLKSSNVATPLVFVDRVVVPLSVPALAVPNVITTDALGTLWPSESVACTITSCEIDTAPLPSEGVCHDLRECTAAAV